jgi:glycosyltransferase involved in cell wall biosynthesis
MFNNLWITNITSLGCNLWSDSHLDLLETLSNNDKTVKFAVMNSENPIKGTTQAVDYCKQNGIEPKLIGNIDPKVFLQQLSEVETFVFLPQSFETFSRLIVEAKILNCKVITNKSSGVVYEDYISQNGLELLNTVRQKKEEILNKLKCLVETSENKFEVKFTKPKVSILTTIYKSGKYIESFLKQFELLEDFENNELIIIDANSPDNEESIIKQYTDKFDNIKYYKTEFCTTSQALNFAAKQANGEFLTFCFVDDKLAPNHNAILSKHLFLSKNVDLVYGDVLVGNNENEQFGVNNQYEIFEHSRNDFSNENMIKCLPGPMPMFRKQMFLNNNGFDNKMNFANDWEFWLRCIANGSEFKKINKIVGLYYNNPSGNSTTQEKDRKTARQKEEKEVFYKYKDIFGEKNFNLFKPYFDSL